MPSTDSKRSVWIVGSHDALHAIIPQLARRGIAARRLVVLGFEDASPRRLGARLRAWGPFDTLIVTSLHAVTAFVRPVLSSEDRRDPRREAWAVGDATARALHLLGFVRVRRADTEGASVLAEELGRQRRRTIVYPRSDRAGPRVAQRLRRKGHRVLDLVAYRTVAVVPPARELRRMTEKGALIVVTSPSAISALRAALSKATFRRWRTYARLIALGERTRRSARGHGFRRVDLPGRASVEGLTPYLAREARDASG